MRAHTYRLTRRAREESAPAGLHTGHASKCACARVQLDQEQRSVRGPEQAHRPTSQSTAHQTINRLLRCSRWVSYPQTKRTHTLRQHNNTHTQHTTHFQTKWRTFRTPANRNTPNRSQRTANRPNAKHDGTNRQTVGLQHALQGRLHPRVLGTRAHVGCVCV